MVGVTPPHASVLTGASGRVPVPHVGPREDPFLTYPPRPHHGGRRVAADPTKPEVGGGRGEAPVCEAPPSSPCAFSVKSLTERNEQHASLHMCCQVASPMELELIHEDDLEDCLAKMGPLVR